MNNNEMTPNFLGQNYKKKILFVIVAVILVFLILWLIIRCSAPKIEQGNQELITPETEVIELEPEPEPETIKTPLGEFNLEDPKQTKPLPEEQVEEAEKYGVLKIIISPQGFSPKEFTVESGQTVSLILKAIGSTHTFRFESPELADIYMGVALGETRGLSFVAPETPGDYVFYCAQPNHRERGEQGVMHVR